MDKKSAKVLNRMMEIIEEMSDGVSPFGYAGEQLKKLATMIDDIICIEQGEEEPTSTPEQKAVQEWTLEQGAKAACLSNQWVHCAKYIMRLHGMSYDTLFNYDTWDDFCDEVDEYMNGGM